MKGNRKRIRGRIQPQHAPLSVSRDLEYGSGYNGAELDRIAEVIGHGSLNDNDVWGPNANQLRPWEGINERHHVDAALIGHQLRGALVVEVYDELDEVVEQAAKSRGKAKQAIDEHIAVAIERERLSQQIKAEGLGFPHWITHSLLYALALAILVLSDMAFNATAYELFGLSDNELFGFIPWTDDLHIAALGSVVALIILAHAGGKRIAEVMHDLNRRRKTTDRHERQNLPPPSRVSMAIAAVCIVGALVLLDGIASIRSGFLKQEQINAQMLAFAFIQLGVFLGALALSISHAHPHGREWIDISRRDRDTGKQEDEEIDLHCDAVAQGNKLIDRGNALFAQAGHHLGASLHNAIGQGADLAWTAQSVYPEPVSEHLLVPDSLPKPKDMSKAELAEFLTGATGLYSHHRLTTDAVMEHRENARLALERCRSSWTDSMFPAPAAVEEAAVEDPSPAEEPVIEDAVVTEDPSPAERPAATDRTSARKAVAKKAAPAAKKPATPRKPTRKAGNPVGAEAKASAGRTVVISGVERTLEEPSEPAVGTNGGAH